MTETTGVVIVGAGPVGLTAALLLGRSGIDVVVLETESAISQELRASTFHPPTLDLLAPFGIAASLIAQGLICPTWQVRLHPSGERAVFDLAVLKGETDHPFRLQCEQSKYCQILHAALASFPCVSIRFSTTVKSLQQTAETVRILATSLNGEQEFFAHYVIGADGARSAVRRDLGIKMSGDVYPEATILATTRFPFHEKLDRCKDERLGT